MNKNDKSIGNAIANSTGATVYGYEGKSRYSDIVAERTLWDKAVDKITRYKDPIATQYWKELKQGILRPSPNQARAGNGAQAMQVTRNGKQSPIPEIPNSGQNQNPRVSNWDKVYNNIITPAVDTAKKVYHAVADPIAAGT